MDRIIGQDRAIESLQRQLSADRLPHGLIFHGPMGVGKRLTAMELAKVLLCHHPVTDLVGRQAACGECDSCKLLRELADSDGTENHANATAHPDLHVVTKELALYSDDASARNRKLTQFPVEVVRQYLIGPVYRRANLGHGKVFIVDEAELLNPSSQNALLKTLEEPPERTTLILITTHEHRLLPTIRSRCQRIAFGPIPDDAIQRFLEPRLQSVTDNLARWAVAFSMGSLGRASLIVDYHLTDWAAAVLPQLQKVAKGQSQPDLGKTMADLIEDYAQAWVKAHDNASKEAAKRMGSDLMLSMLGQYMTRALAQTAESRADEASLQPWVSCISALSTAESRIASNVHLGLVCDGLSAELHQFLLGAKSAA